MTDETQQDNDDVSSDDVWNDINKELGLDNNLQSETPDADSDAIKEIDDLLNDDAADDDASESNDEDDGNDEQSESDDEKTKVDYDQEIEVPMPYGMEKMTVGQLKDAVGNMHLEKERLAVGRREVAEDKAAMNILSGAFAELLTPETKALVQQMTERDRQYNAQMLGEVLPEWKDATVKAEAMKSIAKVAKEHGFTDWEIQNAVDYRHHTVFNELTQLRSLLAKGQQAIKKETKSTKKKATRRHNKPNQAAKIDKLVSHASKSSNKQTKLAAIDKLLT